MARSKRIVLILILVALAGCPAGRDGLLRRTLEIDGVRRVYFVHVPENKGAAMPVVMALHRFAESGPAMARMTGFNGIADREGFLVVYPNGRGRGFDAFPEDGDGDIRFLSAVVAAVEDEFAADPSRTYLTGASNGGTMAYRLACETDLFAAVAPVMAALPVETGETCTPARGIPMLIMHGTDDPVIPYDAAAIEGPPGTIRPIVPVPAAVTKWVDLNACDTEPFVMALEDTDPNDGTVTTVSTYRNGRDGSEVVAYIVAGGGHTWPGGVEAFPMFIVGAQSGDFRASETIWAFFSRYPRTN